MESWVNRLRLKRWKANSCADPENLSGGGVQDDYFLKTNLFYTLSGSNVFISEITIIFQNSRGGGGVQHFPGGGVQVFPRGSPLETYRICDIQGGVLTPALIPLWIRT